MTDLSPEQSQVTEATAAVPALVLQERVRFGGAFIIAIGIRLLIDVTQAGLPLSGESSVILGIALLLILLGVFAYCEQTFAMLLGLLVCASLALPALNAAFTHRAFNSPTSSELLDAFSTYDFTTLLLYLALYIGVLYVIFRGLIASANLFVARHPTRQETAEVSDGAVLGEEALPPEDAV